VSGDLGDSTDRWSADGAQSQLRPRLSLKGPLWALTRAIGGASCFGFRPEPAPPRKACSPRPLAAAAASAPADAPAGDPPPPPAEAPPAKDGAGPAEAGEAGEEGGGRVLKDPEVNDELVKALLGLVDGGGEAVAGWTGCHWETVCVTDGVTVYRARPSPYPPPIPIPPNPP
jgi:hypothetical protein